MTTAEINAAREAKYQADLQFVAFSVQNGLSTDEIRELKPEFTYNEVTPMLKELIAAGIITQEQVDQNRINASRRTQNKNVTLSPDEQVQFILDKVRKGYAPEEIVASDKTKSLTIHKVNFQKRQLIANGIISQEEADNAMKKRQKRALARKHKKVMDKVRKYTELGYTLDEMAEFIEEYGSSQLSKIKSAYIERNGWYTEDELKEFARLRKIREYESLPPEEKKRIEEEKLAEAKKVEEEKRKRKEEALARIQARKDETNNKHLEDAAKLKELIKSGKTMEKSANLLDFSLAYAYKIKRKSVQNGTWLTPEELKELEKKKKQKLARARKKREKQKLDEQNRRKEEEQLRIKGEVWDFREYITHGYTYNEISEKMHYSASHLAHLRKLAIADNIWFSKEELAEFKRLRQIRETTEAENAKKEEQKKQDAEYREAEKAIKEQMRLEEAFNKERKRKIRGYSGRYKKYRKKAKREDALELDGEEDVSTEGRSNFIEILAALNDLDADISDNDIEIVLNTFDMHPEMANTNSIRFLILDANKKGGLKSAEKMITELANTLRPTKYYDPLIQYRKWIKKLSLQPAIRDLKEHGMSNNDIGEKLGISSAEVGIILHTDKKPDFSDFGNR